MTEPVETDVDRPVLDVDLDGLTESMSAAPARRRAGRPGRPRATDNAMATSERLLLAARDSCIEHGFDGTTLADIARRAGIKTPSIYNHYASKNELLVAAARHSLDTRLVVRGFDQRSPAEVVRFLRSDELRDTRRLVLEVHRAGRTHPDVAEALDRWLIDAAQTWKPFARTGAPEAAVKTFFALLLGMCHLDDFDVIEADEASVGAALDALVAVLFAG